MIDNLRLSNRQCQLIQLASEAATDRGIASSLGIEAGTLRTYWDRLRFRFTAQSRTEVIAKVYHACLDRANVEKGELIAALLRPSPFVWTARADGFVDWSNDWFGIYRGLKRSDWEGQGCRALMPPEDLSESASRWKNSQQTGEAYNEHLLFMPLFGRRITASPLAYFSDTNPIGRHSRVDGDGL